MARRSVTRATERRPALAQIAKARRELGENCPADLRPVTVQELETLSTRLAQASSTLSILRKGAEWDAELHKAMSMLAEYLDDCARISSDLHRRHEGQAHE